MAKDLKDMGRIMEINDKVDTAVAMKLAKREGVSRLARIFNWTKLQFSLTFGVLSQFFVLYVFHNMQLGMQRVDQKKT